VQKEEKGDKAFAVKMGTCKVYWKVWKNYYLAVFLYITRLLNIINK
jgi:hypothetical protein